MGYNTDFLREMTKDEQNKEEIEKIRQYCCDVMDDWFDTQKKIIDLINANRDIWKTPYIYGLPDHKNDDHTSYTKGRFCIEANDSSSTRLYVFVENIRGNTVDDRGDKPYSHEGKKDWKAVSIIPVTNSSEWSKGLAEFSFCVAGETPKKDHFYTSDELKKYKWTLNQWLDMKASADRTAKCTKEIVKRFKMALEYYIKCSSDYIDKVQTASNETYTKVRF